MHHIMLSKGVTKNEVETTEKIYNEIRGIPGSRRSMRGLHSEILQEKKRSLDSFWILSKGDFNFGVRGTLTRRRGVGGGSRRKG